MQVYDVCLVGLGPAGIGAALQLTRSSARGALLCLEAGESSEARFCTILEGKGCRHATPCHIIGGVGGSSLLSGGKISTYPAGRSLKLFFGTDEKVALELAESLALLAEFIPLLPPNVPIHKREEARAYYRALGMDFQYYDAYRYSREDLISAYNAMLVEVAKSRASIHINTTIITV